MYICIYNFTHTYIYVYIIHINLHSSLFMFSISQTRWIIGKENRLPGGRPNGGPLAARKSLFQAHLAKVHSMKKAIRGVEIFVGKRLPESHTLPKNVPQLVQIFSLFFFKRFQTCYLTMCLWFSISSICLSFCLYFIFGTYFYVRETCSRLCAPGSSCWPTDASMEPLIMWYLGWLPLILLMGPKILHTTIRMMIIPLFIGF